MYNFIYIYMCILYVDKYIYTMVCTIYLFGKNIKINIARNLIILIKVSSFENSIFLLNYV